MRKDEKNILAVHTKYYFRFVNDDQVQEKITIKNALLHASMIFLYVSVHGQGLFS